MQLRIASCAVLFAPWHKPALYICRLRKSALALQSARQPPVPALRRHAFIESGASAVAALDPFSRPAFLH